ncbi:hypothetical protein F2Q70_00038739 [Brassica cretica]|uniref:Uncharacterized protein n=1 Tax=Brassica cretica TaxID=69181 RepID=A0A8S9K6H2_BRACR|nr:hypothetical protein F2Q70_00038739 [Brassica cretica]
MVHSSVCKQLLTAKIHELLWFVFARRPLRFQGKNSFRCLAMDGDLSTVRLSSSFDIRYIFELAFQCHQFEVNQHPVADVMLVFLKRGQSTSQEKAVEEMKDCRSITQHWCRSRVMPEHGPSIFQDRFKPRSHTKYIPISTRSNKEELLFFSDPARLERSIRKEKHTSSIDTTSTTSINTTSTTSIDTTFTTSIDICDRATIDSSTRTSVDTNPRADMVATLVLQKDENGDLHDPGGHMCNAAGQRIDGQGTAIVEPSAATEDKVPLQRSLADLTRPSQFYITESDDSQSSESIDTKPSASVDALRVSEQPATEKSKSGGRNKNRKKKKKRNADADSLSVVPLQRQ